MDEPSLAYFIAVYGILMIGCVVYTKGLYKELSARIVLGIFSPIVFIVLGPLIAAPLGIVVGILVFPLYVTGILDGPISESTDFGIRFVGASLLCVWGLKTLSDRERRKEQNKTRDHISGTGGAID
ncbi:MAG: hypothetical protein KJT03_15670 [Verrucomicrobiae bacterium]|nr:hypothetical protein [Verrucomicrobiae bacterium]